MSETFRATRGKVVIKKAQLKNKTEYGIIYAERENDLIKVGQVAEIGDPDILKNGTTVPFDAKIGDWVMYSVHKGFYGFGEFDVVSQSDVWGIVDEGTVVK